VDSLVEAPRYGSLNYNADSGDFTYTPMSGVLGRDWFTYKVYALDPDTGERIPGGYVSAVIDVVPMSISLSIGNYHSFDPMTEVPYYNPPVDGGTVPSTTMYLIYPGGNLPDGSTVTLSVDDNTDVEVWDGDPNGPDSTILIDSNTGSYTWTVGDDPVPTQVQVVGINPTDYEQVKFSLSVSAAPDEVGSPASAPAAPAPDPQSGGSQVATVPGKGGYLAAFDGTWQTIANNTDIYKFYVAYKSKADYVPGVGSNQQHPLEALQPWTWINVVPRLFSGAFGGLEAAVQWNTEWDKLVDYYSIPSHEGVPFDTIGWSRGACIAVNLANRVASQAINIRTGSQVVNFHPVIRFVGIISDVNQMGPLCGNWPTSLPGGVEAMFQALDNTPNDAAFPQITVEDAEGTADNGDTIYAYTHGAIGGAANVLTDLENFARMFGVPI